MYNNLFVLCIYLLLTTGFCVSVSGPKDTIVYFIDERTDTGYHFRFVTSGGIARDETGSYKFKPNGEPVLHVKGTYSYRDDLGEIRFTNYEAGEGGFRIIPPEIVIGPFSVKEHFKIIGGPLLDSLIGVGHG